MALTPGRRTVNRSHGKPSWITIKSDTNLFDDDTTISVVDQDGAAWSATPKYQGDPKTLPIKLKGLQTAAAVAPTVLPTLDDAGQLTVTVTSVASPQPKVDIPVSYVNDPSP